MGHRDEIQADLIKLVTDERLLRLSYLPLGLALEKKSTPGKRCSVRKKAFLGYLKRPWQKPI
ncbi:MAG TPA: hypothetical protein VL981_14270 [Candidatus Methylacidiphilales bacterium]|nr:hypothetical protein [Candidatus Methylacidiphilales bacterium]